VLSLTFRIYQPPQPPNQKFQKTPQKKKKKKKKKRKNNKITLIFFAASRFAFFSAAIFTASFSFTAAFSM
jgi:hypothetical protein